jgi:hypothetical protein
MRSSSGLTPPTTRLERPRRSAAHGRAPAGRHSSGLATLAAGGRRRASRSRPWRGRRVGGWLLHHSHRARVGEGSRVGAGPARARVGARGGRARTPPRPPPPRTPRRPGGSAEARSSSPTPGAKTGGSGGGPRDRAAPAPAPIGGSGPDDIARPGRPSRRSRRTRDRPSRRRAPRPPHPSPRRWRLARRSTREEAADAPRRPPDAAPTRESRPMTCRFASIVPHGGSIGAHDGAPCSATLDARDVPLRTWPAGHRTRGACGEASGYSSRSDRRGPISATSAIGTAGEVAKAPLAAPGRRAPRVAAADARGRESDAIAWFAERVHRYRDAEDYYQNPVEDAIVMLLMLPGGQSA